MACSKEQTATNKYVNFDEFLSKIEKIKTTEKKNEFIKRYIEKNKEKFPLFINDSTVVLTYFGKRDSVGIIGDMTDWTDIKYFDKVEDTDFFYLKEVYETNARLEYWLMFGKNSFPSIDSLNRNIILNGFGQISELPMPDYKQHKYFSKFSGGKKGRTDLLQEHNIKSEYLDYEHQVHVYLPPDYDKAQRYSTVYFQDGIDYIEFAQAHNTIEQLINDKKIDPVIAVFVTPPNRHKPEVPNRMTEYGLNDDYVKFFTEELVDFIDSKYSTMASKEERLVIGDSYGGLISLYIGFSRPDIFKNVYSQSGYHSFRKNSLTRKVLETDKKELNIYLDSGTYERNVGASFLPDGERDFLLGNRKMNQALNKKGYNHIYKEYPEGHTWGNWRRHLIDALKHFYGTSKGVSK